MKPTGMYGGTGFSVTGALIVAGLIFLKFLILNLQNKMIDVEEIMTKNSSKSIFTFIVSSLEVIWAIGTNVYANILLA